MSITHTYKLIITPHAVLLRILKFNVGQAGIYVEGGEHRDFPPLRLIPLPRIEY